jgi:polar amino acid transport system substrate-binding protein
LKNFFLVILISFFSRQAYAVEIKSTWYEFMPFSFSKDGKAVGIDIDLTDAVAQMNGYSIKFTEESWATSLKKLQTGELDILSGATLTDERTSYAFFSAPYRFESNSLVLKRNPRIVINFSTPAGLVQELKKKGFRLGTVEGYAYSEPVVAQYVRTSSWLKKSNSKELMQEMLAGNIDGFITDSNEARKISAKSGGKLADVPTGMRSPVRFMLSKKNFTKKDIDKINSSIQKLGKSKLYIDIIKKYSD